MFLSRRATQAEYFDLPTRTPSEVAAAFGELARVNRIFWFAESFQRYIPRALGRDRCRSLSLLDLGAGDGSLGRVLSQWSAKRGWAWEVTSLDINPLALQLNRAGNNVVGSATALPFRDGSFDVVIASQMTHHLIRDEEVCQHFREAWRVTRDLLLLNDVHRNVAIYFVLGCVLHLFKFSKELRSDGLLSVERGWRVHEWQRLARRAGIQEAEVFLYFGARILLRARRGALQQPLAAGLDRPELKSQSFTPAPLAESSAR